MRVARASFHLAAIAGRVFSGESLGLFRNGVQSWSRPSTFSISAKDQFNAVKIACQDFVFHIKIYESVK